MFKQMMLVGLGLGLLMPVHAAAEPMVEHMGVRVGGYGFREATNAAAEESSGTGWQACRMNGLGVFASKGLATRYFLEAGLDTYFTDSFPTGDHMGSYDTPIDRSSALMTMAAGARFYTESLISPYIQIGLGAELTHVSLPALGLEDTALLPMGFFGTGASLRINERTRIGAVLRVNAMGYYDDDQFQTELSPELELATQGQFYASFAL